MELVLTKTGDPWMDWGLTHLGLFWESRDFSCQWSESQLMLSWQPDQTDQIKDKMVEYLKSRLNWLVWPAVEFKILGIERKLLPDGYYDPDYAVPLGKEEKARIRESGKISNPQATAAVTLARNYPGLKGDWKKLKEEVPGAVAAFWAEANGEGEPVNVCTLCGRSVSKEYDMRQNKNPFFNQHHNNVIRGYASGPVVEKICPICNLLNIFAVTSGNLPYAISDYTQLYIPLARKLTVLKKIQQKLNLDLLDPFEKDLVSYRTNIKELERQVSCYQALIGIYHTLVNQFQEQKTRPVRPWEKEEKASLDGWLMVTYNKGQNVIMGTFSYLRVPQRLFELVKPVKYEDGKEGTLVKTGLASLYSKSTFTGDQLARALVEGDWTGFARSLFYLLKDKNSGMRWNSQGFWEKFIAYALEEVDGLLEKELLEDVKVLGRVIGANFPDDIALFTSLNNAHDVESFRKTLKDTLLKLHKYHVAQGKKSDEGKVLRPRADRVEHILAVLNEDNLTTIKDTLLIFAALQAMSKREVEMNENESN
ncbi:hypothetical protein [Carboxydocella sp. JDF658]|uniref:hypothetical protein n=1 Tax=Carboxydocella sp. JDF658 TaxID=1926600 RepID=UPI0009AEBE8A|nr:hypothetical protein [Carboxydocella sp. JDF658]GAW32206.1 hypothetical protein JDF658_19710 [Carboxydocella sp. JDF658]